MREKKKKDEWPLTSDNFQYKVKLCALNLFHFHDFHLNGQRIYMYLANRNIEKKKPSQPFSIYKAIKFEFTKWLKNLDKYDNENFDTKFLSHVSYYFNI